jgi:universal stress protein family protein
VSACRLFLLSIAAAVRLVQRLQCPTGTFTTLFVGAPGDAPAVHCPTVPGWQWNPIVQSGDVSDAIVQMASAMATPLIAMATDGRHGFLDALRGSHSERVLRRTPCPLLAIPVEAAVAPRLSARLRAAPGRPDGRHPVASLDRHGPRGAA